MRSVSTDHLIPDDLRQKYEIHEWRNATGVLATACATEWGEIVEVLRGFQLFKSDILTKGGAKSPIAKKLDEEFTSRGWVETKFETSIVVDQRHRESPTHKVDCFKGRVALEVEWNNKDPFYDRDLNNFRLLFDLQAIDVGVVITRSTELQQLFNELGKGSSYGNSTTHLDKLTPRLDGGGGGGCPILVFAISKGCYVDDD